MAASDTPLKVEEIELEMTESSERIDDNNELISMSYDDAMKKYGTGRYQLAIYCKFFFVSCCCFLT